MFSALRQGSVIYILEKNDKPTLRVGSVLSVSSPQYSANYLLSTVDLTVKCGDQQMEFKNLPSSQGMATYNNAIITETKELMSNEVESMLQNSRTVLESTVYHQSVIETCEQMLRDLNPRFAKEKERDEDISSLKSKMGGIESKMDKILNLLTNKE